MHACLLHHVFVFRWYHHRLSRSEAEDILEDKADFSFLVRDSESSRDPYSLSIR